MKKENVTILEIGIKASNDITYLVDLDLTLPKNNVPLTINYEKDIIGFADNFKRERNKIVCDIESKCLLGYSTAAPKFEGVTLSDDREIQKATLCEVAVIFRHSQEHLNGNLLQDVNFIPKMIDFLEKLPESTLECPEGNIKSCIKVLIENLKKE